MTFTEVIKLLAMVSGTVAGGYLFIEHILTPVWNNWKECYRTWIGR